MVMIPYGPGEKNNYLDFIADLKDLVATKKVSEDRIDDAVRRILRVKFQMGLFDNPATDPALTAAIGSPEHRQVARRCVSESLVLLKNSNNLLPLKKDLKHITVVGKSADDLGTQCGGWTIDWQGKTGNVTTGGTTLLAAVKKTVSAQTEVNYSPDGNDLKSPDVIIVVLVCFSGGKGLRGPQSAGLLLGRKDLIAAARKNAPPNGDTIGRGMKVNKEEILGMLVALEVYLARDHKADWALWEKQIKIIYDAAASVPGAKPEIHVPEVANHVPSLRLTWDPVKIKLTADEFRNALRSGHPSIETVGGPDFVGITTWMMIPGEERIVAKRVKEVLSM